MNAQELRIGNYVYYNDKIISIAPNAILEFYYIGETHSQSKVDRRDYKPIQLSEEILLKCGFRKDKSLKKSYTKDKIRIENFSENIFSVRKQIDIESSLWLNDVNYLHQLQNIMYSIENQELEINL